MIIGKLSEYWMHGAFGSPVGVGMEFGRIRAASSDNNDNASRQTDLLPKQLGSALRLVEDLPSTPAPIQQNQPVTERAIRSMIRLRRNRDYFFDSELFADPAWDMLLELYACHLGQQRISVTSLCAGAAVPATTALRWLAALQGKDLVERQRDPIDARRHFISLTDAGLDAMEGFFRTVPTGNQLV